MSLKSFVKPLLAAALAAAVALPAFAEKTVLNVYTALETDQIKAYQESSTSRTPTLKSSGRAIPPASSLPSFWLKRPSLWPTW